ncbi:MAG TPA: cupredoxin domain-containing protein [Candidatus Binatia bacterium]|nr:cupredoxin domain-containing protein [Candidatus Binatia bacterium]
MKPIVSALSLVVLFAGSPAFAAAAQDDVVELRYENRKFIPQTLNVPAHKPFKIKIVNASKEAIEFESYKVNREKVVGPGETVTVNIPALKPGSYDFYDDFHRDVPEGTIVAK